MITIVKRTIERTMTEEGKAKLSSLVRTNDLTLSTREGDRKVFKFSKQKFAEMQLDQYGILVGKNEAGKGFILVVPTETDGAVLKGTKGKVKNQEFTYRELLDIVAPTESRHGYNLVQSNEVVEGAISVWEIQPTELVRKSSSDNDEEVEDEPALYDATTVTPVAEVAETEETEEEWVEEA